VGSRAGLDAMEYTKISCPCRESNPNSLAVQSVARHNCCASMGASPEFQPDITQSSAHLVWRHVSPRFAVSEKIKINTRIMQTIPLPRVTCSDAWPECSPCHTKLLYQLHLPRHSQHSRVQCKLTTSIHASMYVYVSPYQPFLPHPAATHTVEPLPASRTDGANTSPKMHHRILCCDMMPESWNSPLLDNGSLKHVLWTCRFVETDLVRNALSMSTESTNSFHGYALDYIESSAEKNEAVVRQSSLMQSQEK
jgi:hypothetical protein